MEKKFSIVGITSFFGIAISVLAGLSIFNKVKVTAPVNAGSVDTYYSSVNGTGTELLSSVCGAISSPFQSIAYKSLKDHYANTDPRGDGYLYDIYSDNTKYTISSAGSSASSVGGGWNKEHTIPQSWWGGGETGQGCDIIIVRLSDIHCNSVRGNNLFGEVGTNQDSTIDDNKSGPCSNYSEIGVTSSTTVFEPRDAIKGDMARTYFYAAARYWDSGNHNGKVTTWTSGNGAKVFSANGNNGFVQKYLNMLLRWHREDPVDAREVSRNDAVQSTNCQKNRNPFVDHPSWVDLIWGGTYPSTGLNYENTNGGTAEVVNGKISGGSQTPSIAISPTSGSVPVGNSINLTATATGGSGSVTWSIISGSSKVSLSTTTGNSVTVTGVATGSATIQASYSGETATATISVTAQQTLSSIAVQTAPTKTSYTAGQYFDPTGLVITRNYQGGSSDTYTYANHTGDFSFSPSLSTALTTSDTSVTITYGGKSTPQAITVSENSGSGATDSTQYSLITSTSELEAGKSYIITNGISGTVRAISNASNTNNRLYTEVTVNNGKITRGSSIMSFELGGTSGSWTLKTENYAGTQGYLASATSNNNYLYVQANAGNVTIDFSQNAAVINIGPHSSRTKVGYNSSGWFSCYSTSSGQAAVYLWEQVSSTPAPKTLSSISLDTTNVKKDFIVNESFTYDGLVVTANYSDNTHETVTPTSVSSPNMSSAGNPSVTVTYTEGGVSKTANYSITVSSNPSISWTSPTINVFTGSTLSASDVNGWAVTYNDGAGHQTQLTYDQITVKLGGTTISIPHTWVAEDDGKTLTASYTSLTTSESSAVQVTQSLNNINKEEAAESGTVSWTASAASNLGSKISSVNGTDSGNISTGSYQWAYTRTLVSVASGKSDYIEFQENTWLQLGSGNALESIVFTTSSIPGTITNISVVAATAGTHKITIDVGGTKYLNNANLTTYSSSVTASNPNPSNCVVNGTGSSSGTITISIASSSSTNKAMVIRSISVSYNKDGGTEQIANNSNHIAAQRVAVKFAKAFNDAMDDTEYCTTGLSSAWSTCSSAYNTFKSEAAALGSTEEAYAKNLIKYATAQYSDDSGEACIERMLKTYEVCVSKHGQTAFMSDLVTVGSNNVSPLVNIVGGNKSAIIIVIISLLSASIIAGYFFIQRRKPE